MSFLKAKRLLALLTAAVLALSLLAGCGASSKEEAAAPAAGAPMATETAMEEVLYDETASGESGAASFGCVAEIMTNPELSWLKEKLGLNENSRVLFFSTEGDTDQENYKSIVWDGKHPSTR